MARLLDSRWYDPELPNKVIAHIITDSTSPSSELMACVCVCVCVCVHITDQECTATHYNCFQGRIGLFTSYFDCEWKHDIREFNDNFPYTLLVHSGRLPLEYEYD